jgi:hypothetical protein
MTEHEAPDVSLLARWKLATPRERREMTQMLQREARRFGVALRGDSDLQTIAERLRDFGGGAD